MKPTPEQLEAFARWNGQTHAGKNATVSNITAETIKHGENKYSTLAI